MNRILIAATLLLLIWTSSAAAQDITPTDPPSPTASSTPLPTITLTLFRDADSLTLLVPASSLRVSLVGLEYRVTLLDGQTIIRRLDRDFASFFGLPFDQISVIGAACFRLVKSGTIGPVPIECTNGPTLFTQQLAAADGFWFDAGINLPRIVSLWQDTAFVGICPAEQNTCTITFSLQAVIPTATPPIIQPVESLMITPTPDKPLATFITGVNVRRGPDVLFEPPIGSYMADDTAEVLATNPERTWYKVRYFNSEGWVFANLLTISGNIDNLPVDFGPPKPTLTPTRIPVTPTPQPNINLVAGSITTRPSEKECGQTFMIYIDVANFGPSKSSISLIAVEDISNGLINSTRGSTPEISPGQTVHVGPIPLTVGNNPNEIHILRIVIDPNNTISETNENDNRAEHRYTLARGNCVD